METFLLLNSRIHITSDKLLPKAGTRCAKSLAGYRFELESSGAIASYVTSNIATFGGQKF